MFGVEGKCCEKKLLYEIETPGLLYLSLDGKAPVYVGFQHRLKLEIRLVYPEGQSKTLLKSGILNPITPGLGKAVSKNFGDVSKCLGARSEVLGAKKDPVVQLSSPEIYNALDHEDSDSLLLASQKTSAYSAFPALNQIAEQNILKGLHLTDKKTMDKTVVKKIDKYKGNIQIVTKQSNDKSLTPKTPRSKGIMIMSREQLELYRSKTGSKKMAIEEPDMHKLSEHPQRKESTTEKKQESINQGKEDLATTTSLERSVNCQYCAQSFPSQKELYKHRKLLIENYHVCLKCNVAYPFKAYLLAHIKYHNKKGLRSSYDCSKCKFTTSKFNDFKKHMIFHTREHSFQCCKCSKTFFTYSSLLKHAEVHRTKGLQKCSCCNEYFSSKSAMWDHKLANLSCGLCGQIFPNTASRLIHYNTVHVDTILRCPQCDHIYSHQEELDRHLKWHKHRRLHQCTVCGAFVVNLTAHMHTHEMPDSALYSCDHCPKKFKSRRCLKDHSRSHTREKIHCHVCSKSFITNTGLSSHLYNAHSNIMRHQCKICGKQCKQKSNLKVHMRIHCSVKLFPCSYCEQAFNYKASLDVHVRSKHFSESTGTAVNLNAQEAASNFLGPLNTVDTHENGDGDDNALSTISTAIVNSTGYPSQEMKSNEHDAESSSLWIEPGNIDAPLWTADMSKMSEPGLHQDTLNFVTQQNKDFQHQNL